MAVEVLSLSRFVQKENKNSKKFLKQLVKMTLISLKSLSLPFRNVTKHLMIRTTFETIACNPVTICVLFTRDQQPVGHVIFRVVAKICACYFINTLTRCVVPARSCSNSTRRLFWEVLCVPKGSLEIYIAYLGRLRLHKSIHELGIIILFMLEL